MGENETMAEGDGKRRRDEGDDHVGGKTKRPRRSCYLPEGISREILLKLPVKSLVRFRSINRGLCHLISSERFAADHLRTFLGDEESLLGDRWWCTAHRSCQSEHQQDLDRLHPKGKYRKVVVVGCCDGIVCLICSSRDTCNVVLWNPVIRTMVTIPTSFRCMYPARSTCRFGFGYINNEYKLVVIPRRCQGGTFNVNVFSLKTGKSESVSCFSGTGLSKFAWVILEQRSVFVNGACHWLAEAKGATIFVLSFDLCQRSFRNIIVPSYLGPSGSNNPCYSVKIFVYNGCLSLISTMMKRKNQFVVWTMEQYDVFSSWTRRIESKNRRGSGILVSFKGGETMCGWNHGREIVCTNRITMKRRYLKAIPGVHVLCRLHAFKESIVLLNQDLYQSRGFGYVNCSQHLRTLNKSAEAFDERHF